MEGTEAKYIGTEAQSNTPSNIYQTTGTLHGTCSSHHCERQFSPLLLSLPSVGLTNFTRECSFYLDPSQAVHTSNESQPPPSPSAYENNKHVTIRHRKMPGHPRTRKLHPCDDPGLQHSNGGVCQACPHRTRQDRRVLTLLFVLI